MSPSRTVDLVVGGRKALSLFRTVRLSGAQLLVVVLMGVAAAWISLAPALAHAQVPEYQTFEVLAPQPQANANFGERLRTLADVDGDGARDVLISASNFDAPNGSGGLLANAGRLYVYSGRTRALLRTIEPPTPQANAKFGFWSASLGDVNADGAGDFVTSAPTQVVGGATVGQVYVYSGRDGTLLRTINPPESLGMTGMFGGDFGGNLIAPGDLTGDGVSDLVATASGSFAGNGAAYAFNGATGAFLYKVSNPSMQPSSLGFGAAEVGDVNADGVGDYQLGAPRFDEGAVMDVGRSYIINGATGAVIFTLMNPEPEANDRFGQADADGISLGDITGDGRPDIYVDSFLANDRPADQGAALDNSGKVFLFDGASGNLIRALRDPEPGASRTFGSSNAGAGDLDRDGRLDAIVSSRGGNAGRVTVFGGSGLQSVLKVFQDPQAGSQEGALFGSSISSPGDVNGDGLPDYFISSRSADVHGDENVGTAYAFISRGPTPGPTPDGDDDGGPRVRPNLLRPVARVSQSGSRIVVRVRGRMVGNRGRACGGRIKIGTRAGRRRVATRTARMARNCRYSARYTIPARRLPKRLRPRNRTLVLSILVRYQGNSLLTADLSPPRRVKVRR